MYITVNKLSYLGTGSEYFEHGVMSVNNAGGYVLSHSYSRIRGTVTADVDQVRGQEGH